MSDLVGNPYDRFSHVTAHFILCHLRCSKELNQWDLLLEYANSKGNTNPHLVLESAWRVPNWALMKDALSQVGEIVHHYENLPMQYTEIFSEEKKQKFPWKILIFF